MAAGARSRTMRLILAGDMDGLNRTLQRAQARSKGFGATIKRASAIAVKALAAVGVAALAMGAQGVAAFADFDKGVREVGTLLGDIGDHEIKALGDDIRDVSKAFGQEAPQVARAFYDSISAGVANAETAKGFAEDAARFATAGATDISTGVDLLSSAINAYGLSADDAGKVSDTLFATVRAGKTTVAELAANFSQVGPVAASAGVGLEEVMGWVAQLTLSGTPTAQAMTQVRAALAELLNPAKKLSKNFAEVAGQTFPEFIASGGTLQEALALIQTHADDTGMGMTEMTSRIEGAMALLGATGDNADRFADTLASVADSAGATDTAFEVMSEGMAFRLDQLKAKWHDLKIGIGEALVPVLEWAMDAGPKILAFIREHADVLKPLAIGLGAVTVALAAAKVATVAWNAVLAINPVVAAAAAVAALTVAIVKLTGATNDATDTVEDQANVLARWVHEQDKWYESVGGFAADVIRPFIRRSELAKAAAADAADSLADTSAAIDDVVGQMIRHHEANAERAEEITRRQRRMALDEMALLEEAAGAYDAAAEQASEIARRRRREGLDEMAILAGDFVEVVERMATDTVVAAEPALTVLREGLPNSVAHAVDATDAELRRLRAQWASIEATSQQTAERIQADWALVASGQQNAYAEIVQASAEKRAALLDDLAAELDGACAAAEGMNACQERLANDWNLYGGQMVESTAYFVGSWTEARAVLADQVAAAAEAVETGSTRIVKATETAAEDVKDAADDMATYLGGSMGEIESATSQVARLLGLDVEAMEAALGGLPAVADAAALRTSEALGRLAEATGLTVTELNAILDRIPKADSATPKAGRAAATSVTMSTHLPDGTSVADWFSRTFDDDADDLPPTLPRLGRGGVVTRPTVALVGEAGPEAVVPLSRYRRAGDAVPGTLHINLHLDGNRFARWIIERFNEALRRGEINVESSLN